MIAVDRLDSELRQRGIRTLVDRTSIEYGEPWRERLKDLISQAETMIFMISPHSVASAICAEEVAFGKRLAKRLIPVVVTPVENVLVPEILSELNYLYLDDEASYGASLDRLAENIKTDIGWMRLHAEFGRLAEEWMNAGRPRGLLLNRTYLNEAERWIEHRPANAPVPTESTRALISAGRRAKRLWRNLVLAALTLVLTLTLTMLAWALVQRQHAIQQTAIADEQRDAATKNLSTALETTNGVIYELSRGLRNVVGVKIDVIQAILSKVEKSMNRLSSAAPQNEKIMQSHIAMLHEFGDTSFLFRDMSNALKYFERAKDESHALLEKDNINLDSQEFLAVSLNKIGSAKRELGDRSGAMADYSESVKTFRLLVEKKPESRMLRQQLASSLGAFGSVERQEGNLEAASRAIKEETEILRSLAKDQPHSVDIDRDLSVALTSSGDLKNVSRDLPGAEDDYEDALKIIFPMHMSVPENVIWGHDVIILMLRSGDVQSQLGRKDKALNAFEGALDGARSLQIRDRQHPEWQLLAATSLAYVASLTEDRETRRDKLTEALGLVANLEKRHKNLPDMNGLREFIQSQLDSL